MVHRNHEEKNAGVIRPEAGKCRISSEMRLEKNEVLRKTIRSSTELVSVLRLFESKNPSGSSPVSPHVVRFDKTKT
jgi:hypothetical protein